MSKSNILTTARRQAARAFQSPPCNLPPHRRSSSLTHLPTELTSRRLPLTYDYLTPTPSHLLNITLTDFLPPNLQQPPTMLPSTSTAHPLPPTHHLIYFPPATPPSTLLPDGTDPLQSPGPPFVRRMWAGGRILFSRTPPTLAGNRYVCMEGIRDVQIKGNPDGSEKIFVAIERRIGPAVLRSTSTPLPASSKDDSEELMRRAFWRPDPDEFGSSTQIIERRTIVFMRAVTPSSSATATSTSARTGSGKILKASHAPTFTHTLTPTPQLLFRYSALTFNAHSIHLDKSYCQSVEGRRNLLVHGPLSLTLMIEVLGRFLAVKFPDVEKRPRIAEVEYRNLAPLYAGEKMNVCAREVIDGGLHAGGEYEVWIEGKEGGLAVRGKVKTEPT
ncbi:MAG: hypothetical protein M1830_002437 [Pleopsidium flavum]|nr:MAG: hypothetical protein M1830_002437 [Pleopsidium flavum]